MKFLAVKSMSWVLALCAGSVNAENFILGVESTDYYPYWDTRDSQYVGYSRELFDAFGQKYGHTFKYEVLPVKRLFDDFIQGRVDFKYPDNAFWGQDGKKGHAVVYSEPVAPYIDGALVKPERKGKGLDHIKTLGTITGFTAWDYLDVVKAGKVKLAENPRIEGLLKMVLTDRVDAIYFNPVVANYQLTTNKLGADSLVFDASLPHTRSNYHLSTIKHFKVIEEFNQFLKDEAGQVEKLRNKYEIKLDPEAAKP